MSQCVRCGGNIGLFKTGGRIEEGQRFYELRQDPGTGQKVATLREVSGRSSIREGRLCKPCWAKWEAEQEEGRLLMAAAQERRTRQKAEDATRESSLRDRALALDRMRLADADTLAPYRTTMKNATRSEIMGLGKDSESVGVRDRQNGELTATFFAVAGDSVREWVIARTGPTTWIIAQVRSGRQELTKQRGR